MPTIPANSILDSVSNQKPATEMTYLDILKNVFGYNLFRGQLPAIETLVSGKDTIVVILTGGGKTVTYILPCVMTPGTAIIISPLIMPMIDQVSRLCSHGINTCYYNTLLTDNEKQNILHHLRERTCQYEFVFISPEAVVSEPFEKC